jgi:hypothetical protein
MGITILPFVFAQIWRVDLHAHLGLAFSGAVFHIVCNFWFRPDGVSDLSFDKLYAPKPAMSSD